MNKSILFVDDDPLILSSFRRSLSDEYTIETADGPEAALAILRKKRFAVVVSDLKMPGMDGITFLEKVYRLSKETTRIILTGFADLEVAINAVNRGHIFRFLVKPCQDQDLRNALNSGLEQHRLIVSERVLLERTLKGAIEVLTETLSLVNPEAFGRSMRIRRFVHVIASQMFTSGLWQYEIAAMLSQIGCVLLPGQAIEKIALGQVLSPSERQLYDMVPEIGRGLVRHIPRLGTIGRMIAYQRKNFDGSGIPIDDVAGEDIPLGARILRVAIDFEEEMSKRHDNWGTSFLALEDTDNKYDPQVLYFLECALGVEARFTKEQLPVGELRPGMILNHDIMSNSGVLLARKSLEVSKIMLARLSNFKKQGGLIEPIEVLIPIPVIPTAQQAGDEDD
ncbi:HD domain-containing phosphohydrolase [Desulfovibrio inopinatus]|uniref:HD domain-containing phosphohydrolase n=1 Tax=Desulfovibrio inopinatus TaxID=102109 RepID=UPI000411D127|nr:HD domain-containing phosphohydrolase [Desulfovibrio inopinatus]